MGIKKRQFKIISNFTQEAEGQVDKTSFGCLHIYMGRKAIFTLEDFKEFIESKNGRLEEAEL